MAALLVGTFVAFAIIGRVGIQYFTTGNHGIRLANAQAEPVAAMAGGTFSLSFVVSLVIVALDFSNVWLIQPMDMNYLNEFALTLGLSGVAVIFVAQMQMGEAWRIGVDQSEENPLVTNGLFSKSRNPIYFGIALYWVGLSLLLPHPSIWVLALLCWSSIEVIVRKVEEPYLLRLHGPRFESYTKRTKRYIIW